MLFHSIVNGIVTTWQNVLHSRCVIRDDDLYWYVRISMNTLICACVYVYVRGCICVCRYGCLWVCLRVCTILYVYVWAVHEVNRAVLRYMCITCVCVHLLIESASRVLCSIVCMTMYSMYTSGNDCVNESMCIQQLSAPLILLLFDCMYLTGDLSKMITWREDMCWRAIMLQVCRQRSLYRWMATYLTIWVVSGVCTYFKRKRYLWLSKNEEVYWSVFIQIL